MSTTTRSGRLLSAKGLIARRLSQYEPRPQQVEMANAVEEALSRREHLMVEAGTGVGKTFAYLLPAIERVTRHRERAVISTRTIALQEQLINKDIPFLQSILPREFSAVLVKGRSNYVGLRRLAMTSRRQDMLLPGKKQRQELWRIEDWATTTEDGSLSDLSPQPLADVWALAKSEHGNCMGRRCPHYEPCFYQRARRRAEHAQLLVVNHALFFADLALRAHGSNVLPDYDFAVLDEAHSIEEVAADHFGLRVTDMQVQYLLNTLYNERTGQGFLACCHTEDGLRGVQRARHVAQVFFSDLLDWQASKGRPNGRLAVPPPVENTLSPVLRSLAGRLLAARSELTDEGDRFELTSYIDRSLELASELEVLLGQDQKDWVYWLDSESGQRRQIALCANPIEVNGALQEMLFGRVASVVLTSATLATTGAASESPGAATLDYMCRRVGLEQARTLRLGSPFDFASQMEVHIESWLPDPAERDEFVRTACQAMARHIRQTAGKALVLFTSYEMLEQCARQLQAFFEEEGILLLVQGGSLSRSAILERFRQQVDSVIFGTDSFWEGIDVPGEALSNVIIVKLPFAVPSRPRVEARIERIRRAGRDPFGSFQLPEAILKFRQGAGRLIRTKRDRGRLVILDPRIVRKPYGRAFLDALPPCSVTVHERPPSA